MAAYLRPYTPFFGYGRITLAGSIVRAYSFKTGLLKKSLIFAERAIVRQRDQRDRCVLPASAQGMG